MYQQVPMVEIDGMYLVQTRAILRYIASKYNLYGKDLKEQALIDMYVEGMRDLYDIIMLQPLCLPQDRKETLRVIAERANQRFLPVYEKALKDPGKNYLVGNQLSWADILLLEFILMVEECKPGILSAFPKLQIIPSIDTAVSSKLESASSPGFRNSFSLAVKESHQWMIKLLKKQRKYLTLKKACMLSTRVLY
ncbi:glutathione S-transferase-like isoform X3 [Monodelphis domestica]|nr:glutathione S-transferase-like isoform X3 [Monodelphis domestica]